MKYKVTVEKELYCTGAVTVDCDDPTQALSLVENQINNGTLTTSDIKWSEPEYLDWTFDVTGDVD